MVEYIDNEEKDLIESLHSEKWDAIPNNDINKQYMEYALNSLEFNSKIELNISERDLQQIKTKAVQEGIPYQALISMLIHKYNEGKVAISL